MKFEIIVIGAGACGLMAARELAKGGKRVLVLEARNRVGGRIQPLSDDVFGYPAQGGAEFVHGQALVTKALLKEAGLTYEAMPDDGENWSSVGGVFSRQSAEPGGNSEIARYRLELNQKLRELQTDTPVAEFLRKHFPDDRYLPLRSWVMRLVKDFDAADPEQISTFSLRDEWLGHDEWEQGRIKEGYGKLLEYLESECRKYGVEIRLGAAVESVRHGDAGVSVMPAGELHEGERVIVTAALPGLSRIQFDPPLPEKMSAAAGIGFGQVIKVLLGFSSRWWSIATDGKLDKMAFMFTDQPVSTWWTQYPLLDPVLTGWISGPDALVASGKSDQDIVDLAVSSLAGMFGVSQAEVSGMLVASHVSNWPADPLTRGAYSYSKVGSDKAYEELRSPVSGRVYFAGEALYLEKETATVEGALASGKAVAGIIR